MNKVLARLRNIIGISTHHAATKFHKVSKKSWTSLSVEQLESRDLLATLLPAPSSALFQHPASNPALPADFDVFNPSVGNVAIASLAPQLATLTNQARPNDNLAVTGFQFSNVTGASAGKDTVFQVFGQTTATNSRLASGGIRRLNGDRAVVTLNAELPQNSMYLVWAVNSAGASRPFAVNKTAAWWVGPDDANPGKTVSIYGQNLSNGAATPKSWIYLQPAQGLGRWITPTAVNPYKVDFVVPTGLANGSYQLWVHNGHGGQYGWSSPVTLTVNAPYDYGKVVVKLADFAGGLPNTNIDATPALLAAIAKIGNNGPGTIQLQAGTYYLSSASQLAIVAGWNRGIHLQGAGKNATFFKPLPGFTAQYFLKFGTASKVSDLTIDATGAKLSEAAVSCNDLTNVKIVHRSSTMIISSTNLDYFYMKNSDLVGQGIFLGNTNQVLITGSNFYATNSTASLLYVWGGNGISITNCTAQDYNVDSTNIADRGRGRFFTGTALWETQSNIYIGDNSTKRFAPAPQFWDQNVGEQLMWEGNQVYQSTMAVSATGNTVTLASLNGNRVGMEAVIVGGKGIGQHRTILNTNFAAGGSTVTLESPWDVVPDASSRISIVSTIKNGVVYRNTLQGNSSFATSSASQGIELFEGGMDFVVDSNTISDFRYGISAFTYSDSAQIAARPLFATLYQNNTISNCSIGIRSSNLGNPAGETATHLGNIFRNNTMTRIHESAWFIVSGNTSMDLVVFEHNDITHVPVGVSFYLPCTNGTIYLVIYKNVFDRGAAPVSSSMPIAWKAGYFGLFHNNRFLNFLHGTNPTGVIDTLLPTFSWNTIPGANCYDVWLQDTTTGLAQQAVNVQGTSWKPSTALLGGHTYRWRVLAKDGVRPASDWSPIKEFYIAPLPYPTLIAPLTAPKLLTADALVPTFKWAAVTGATSYELWVKDMTDGFSQVVRQITTRTDLKCPVALTAGHRYVWFVRALNNAGYSMWGQGAIYSLLIAPTPLGPSGTAIGAKPTFTWSGGPGADYYEIWVSDLTHGGMALATPLKVTGTSWTAPTALNPNNNYYWCIRARTNSGAASDWSNNYFFTTELSTPLKVSPIASASKMDLVFQWTAAAGANYYDIWINDLTTGQSPVVRSSRVTTTSLKITALTKGHTYSWRIRALSDNGNCSAWSTFTSFNVT